MPSLPRAAMNFAVVQDVGYRLPGVTAFAAAMVAPPRPLGGIQLKHSKAVPVDKSYWDPVDGVIKLIRTDLYVIQLFTTK
ncbi:hypothetical protein TNCT_482971 [Trichonephila clavata]|uniref:Uncharacterized protein n=1 Tax=Trichonephila clavata TaxID=2740835 RepID=A0A8X6EXR7_TRICU|nr:hypothetical protein TNCT_482971 [Trichonephila clavata]